MLLPLLVFAVTAGLIYVPLTMTLVAGISDEHAGVASSKHALSDGVTTALTIGAGATVLALIVTLLTIRVRREDLPDGPMVM